MRNIFDQYSQPENKLTHALVSSLAADPVLLRKFVHWATGETAPYSLEITEQRLPGEEEAGDESEAERRGLPDAWIYNERGWALIIESKIASSLKRDQLERHRRAAERHGFTDIHLLALVIKEPPRQFAPDEVTICIWTKLYSWLLREGRSEWARRLTSYMEILETKLVDDKYLREGTLTMFAGIHFGKDYPYNYEEAKRLLRLAMDELRRRKDLTRELGMDPEGEGRPSITGKEGRGVWDFVPLAKAKHAKQFTEFPHLTLGIGQERLTTIVAVPNGIRREFRSNLLEGGKDKFIEVFDEIYDNLRKSLSGVEGASPWMEIIQRHYPSQKAEPIVDARLEFDLQTAEFGGPKRWRRSAVKQQPQWLDAAYDALSSKHSNLQLAIGAIFPYKLCPEVRRPEILNHVARVWLACKPLIRAMVR